MEIERRAVTSHDISFFLDQYRLEQLDLDPPYQRRSVWTLSDRRFFLDTIFRGYPSPSVYLHKDVQEGRTVYHVVDGKQRLETILLFAQDQITIDRRFGDTRLSGKHWSEINDDGLRQAFQNYVIPVEQLNITTQPDYVSEVFSRLNRNARRLNDQELRHARYEGWFISFVENESDDPLWEQLGIVTTTRRKRMADVQFLSELLIVVLSGKVWGFNQDSIDSFHAAYDDPWETMPDFDEGLVRRQFEMSKDYALGLVGVEPTLREHIGNVTHMYTLWCLINLNPQMPPVEEFAPEYAAFMNEAKMLQSPEFLEAVTSGIRTVKYKTSLDYYAGSHGASTDLSHRNGRYQALMALL